MEVLQSHFTWDLEASRQNLIYLRDQLEDISTEEGVFWRGHISNLLGFIQHQLGSSKEALKLFNQATEIFRRLNNADEGPLLLVNFGNLAWLHHLMGEDEKSQNYLSKVEDLMKKYPAPPEEQLHPEVCAEKAWTLMKFNKEKKQQAAELFQRAVQMQPDVVEWQSSWAILSALNVETDIKKLYADGLENLRSAKERDPDNLCVAALYLETRAALIKHEAKELAERILERPINNYCGLGPLLTLYRNHISLDGAVQIATEAVRRNPDSRYAKRSAAQCYTNKIFSLSSPDPRRINEAVSLWEEVIAAYPESSLREKITLADVHAKQDKQKADQIYQELLGREDLSSAEKQMLYSHYAKHLYFIKNNSRESVEYHKRAVEIPEESKYRQMSIVELQKALQRNPERREEIEKLLAEVQHRLRISCKVSNTELSS